MAAGVNYNGVWAGLGEPISPIDGHKNPYHIAGSDASGIVWAIGAKVKRWKVGDEVVIHCNQDDGDDEECNGGDPMFSTSQRIWGYETPDGSFPQFCEVQARQLMKRRAIGKKVAAGSSAPANEKCEVAGKAGPIDGKGKMLLTKPGSPDQHCRQDQRRWMELQ